MLSSHLCYVFVPTLQGWSWSPYIMVLNLTEDLQWIPVTGTSSAVLSFLPHIVYDVWTGYIGVCLMLVCPCHRHTVRSG